MQKSRLYFLGLVTLLGFPLVGLIITWIVEGHPFNFELKQESNFLYQILLGLLAGTVSALLAWRIIQFDFLASTREKYGSMIRQFDMNIIDIIFLSICAGVGEELLFRGVIQPYLGIWITSILFVAIHGYLNPMDWKISIYGVFMTVVIIGISYMNDYLGITSAIVAHFTIDVILLLLISKKRKPHELD